MKESPVSFECIVKEIQPLGTEGGAGNLVICEVVLIHIDEAILDENGKIDTFKVDHVARMGENWYCRTNSENIFEVAKPLRQKGIGIEQLPIAIKSSNVLTGNDLAILANIEALPTLASYPDILDPAEIERIKMLSVDDRHKEAQFYLHKGLIDEAWISLLI